MRELRRIKEDRDVEEAYKVKRYEAYKNAVVEWLEQVPSHWRSTNIRAITKLVVENNRPDLPLLSVYRDYGVILKDSRDDNHNRAGEDLSHYKVVKPGRLVLNKMKTWQGSLGVSQYTGIVSPAYITCDLHEAHNPRFIHFLLRSYQYIVAYNKLSYGVRVDQWDMRYEDFKQLPLYLPPREEQDAIVAFLDHKLAEIDRFIANKQRLIELLKEQKSAIINRVIIQGLELAVQLKPSGIEWIGDIPKHWDVKKIKYVAKIERGIFSHRPRNDPSMYDGPYPFIQTGDVRSADKYIRNYHQTLNESGFSVSKYFRKGTLVMTIAANVADVGILDFDACFPDSLVGFVPYKLSK